MRAEPRLDVMDFCPAQHPVMVYGWLGALHFAMGQDEIVEAFRRDTGNAWTPGRTALDRLIDEATGAPEGFLRAFLPWFNEHIWGDGNKQEEGIDAL